MSQDPDIGQVIDGRFRLDALLGAGGMGKVFRARQLSVDRDVAVKVLRPELSELPSIQQRFDREARVIAAMRHPNVIGLLDFGRDEATGSLFIAMEYIEGHTLTDLLAKGKPPLNVLVDVFRQISAGLAQAHQAGVVHRDLKPDNVMLQATADGKLNAKILDFGIALPQGEHETRYTQTGAVLGTPHYMSPEQIQDQPVDHRSDLYALGAMMYRALTGAAPFQADTPLALLFKTVHEQHMPIAVALADPSIPAELSGLVDRLLAKSPADRPNTAAEVAQDLEKISVGLGLPGPATVDEMTSALSTARDLPAARDSTTEGEQFPPPSEGLSGRVLLMGLIAVFCLGCVIVLGAVVIFLSTRTSVPRSVKPVPQPTRVERPTTPITPIVPELPAVAIAETKPPEPAVPKPEPKPKPPRASTTQLFKNLQKSSKQHAACQRGECRVSLTTKEASYVCQTDDAKCVVDCAAGGCRTSCQGADCTFGCSGGGCAQVCFSGECKFSCSGGDCDPVNLGKGRYESLD